MNVIFRRHKVFFSYLYCCIDDFISVYYVNHWIINHYTDYQIIINDLFLSTKFLDPWKRREEICLYCLDVLLFGLIDLCLFRSMRSPSLRPRMKIPLMKTPRSQRL